MALVKFISLVVQLPASAALSFRHTNSTSIGLANLFHPSLAQAISPGELELRKNVQRLEVYRLRGNIKRGGVYRTTEEIDKVEKIIAGHLGSLGETESEVIAAAKRTLGEDPDDPEH